MTNTYECASKCLRTESITKYKLITINTRWEATQWVTEAKRTRLTHKIAIQLHLVTESCTICSSRSRRPVWKLLDTRSYTHTHIHTGRPGFNSRQGQWLDFFLFAIASRPSLEPTGGVCEVDYSPPSSTEVQNAWIYTSTPPICLHGVVLN
jgi:hypothetical protein